MISAEEANDLAESIGWIFIAFGQLEFILDIFLSTLYGSKQSKSYEMIIAPMSYSQKVEMFETHQRFILDSKLDHFTFDDRLKSISDLLKESGRIRNRYAHAQWHLMGSNRDVKYKTEVQRSVLRERVRRFDDETIKKDYTQILNSAKSLGNYKVFVYAVQSSYERYNVLVNDDWKRASHLMQDSLYEELQDHTFLNYTNVKHSDEFAKKCLKYTRYAISFFKELPFSIAPLYEINIEQLITCQTILETYFDFVDNQGSKTFSKDELELVEDVRNDKILYYSTLSQPLINLLVIESIIRSQNVND